MCSTTRTQQFSHHGNTLGFRPSKYYKAFLGTFGVPFANGGSYVHSSKHMNMLARICGTI